MATITKRKTASGIRYKAEILIKQKGEIIHRESKTFSKRGAAKDWADEREYKLRSGGELKAKQFEGISVRQVVQRYIDTFTPEEGFGRTKKSDIERLLDYPMSKKSALTLTVQDLVDHAKWRKKGGTGPATVNNDFIWLSSIFETIAANEGIPIDLTLIPKARVLMKKHKLIARSGQRDRRPTKEELWKLSRHFWRKQKYETRSKIPMLDIMWFQIYSTRRDSETCRIEWKDNNNEKLTGMVRDVKHPTKKKGNHKRFKYTRSAWKIVQKQAHSSEYIFPYNPKSVSAAFTRACKILGIEDLHLHDMRHEGTSRLFEQGYSIEQVALHTLHSDWKTLQRYTHLRPEDIE